MHKRYLTLSPLLINTIILCFIAGITIFAYWGIQNHQFLNFDDDMYVLTNDYVKNGISLENIKWAFSFNGEGYWHPLTWLSLMLDCQLFGLESGPLLIENLILHILNALLLFLIILRLTNSRAKAALIALLFAIHPINVESVAWLVERKTVLSALFLMAGIYAYILYTETKNKWLYCLTLFLYAIGLMAKPIIITFPFLLLILDYWPLKRFKSADAPVAVRADDGTKQKHRLISLCKSDTAKLVFEKLPFIILSMFSLIISMQSLLRYETVIHYASIPVSLRISNFFVSIIKYIHLLSWPVELSIFYPFPKSIPVWHFLLAMIFVVVITILFFSMRKTRPWLVVGWCWFIVTLMPASGLIQSGLWPSIANRFMYLPLIGLLIMFVWELDQRLSGRYAIFLKIILSLALIIYLSSLTRVQNLYFSNSYSLFHRSLAVAPDNALALNNIGVHLVNLGRYDEAMKYLARGIKLYPTKPSYYQNYGICLVSKGDDMNAIIHFQKAIKLDPKLYGSYLNLGLIQSRRGYNDEALKYLEKAMEINPNNLSVRNNYATILVNKGKHEEAITHFLYVLKREHANVPARINLAKAYQDVGRFDDAMREYEFLDQTIKSNKGYIYYGMAGVYSAERKYQECLNHLEKAQKSKFDVLGLLNVDNRFKNFRESKFYLSFLEKIKASGSK